MSWKVQIIDDKTDVVLNEWEEQGEPEPTRLAMFADREYGERPVRIKVEEENGNQ